MADYTREDRQKRLDEDPQLFKLAHAFLGAREQGRSTTPALLNLALVRSVAVAAGDPLAAEVVDGIVHANLEPSKLPPPVLVQIFP